MFKKCFFILGLCLLPQIVLAGEEYDACYRKAADDNGVALCMKAETARIMKDIQEVYVNLSKNPRTAPWNKGNGLISGNLKDMYDHFIAYRNRFCSLFVVASEENFGSSSYDKERCLLQLTNDHYELILQTIVNANTGSEESDLDH